MAKIGYIYTEMCTLSIPKEKICNLSPVRTLYVIKYDQKTSFIGKYTKSL